MNYFGKNLNHSNGVVTFKDIIKPLEDKALEVLTNSQRIGFLIAYVLLFVISLTANIATIVVICKRERVEKRKMRAFQKTSTISLVISDIVVAFFQGGNNIIMLSRSMNNWILGKFMCAFVPYIQNTGQIANSITMALIAFDRYRSIVHSTNNEWKPKLWICILIFMGVWLVPAGMSLPQFKISNLYGPFDIYTKDPNKPILPSGWYQTGAYLCQYSGTGRREDYLIFYTLIGCATFLPSMILFLWLHFKIAQLIWRRRESPGAKYDNPSVTMETSVADSKTSVKTISQTKTKNKKIPKSQSKRNMERKIRTFKIILSIMLIFFLCRMPHWIFNIIRFASKADKNIHWVISYFLSLLLLFNTAINPFLYSFLNQTIEYLDKICSAIGNFVVKIFCCSGTEFDDYEKEPSSIHSQHYEQRNSQSSTNIVARGPYADSQKNTYVPGKY